ncbi:hypothetical protein U14_04749 [Candidatus Moduliflexus flocculans]|uniref:Uncharacterized protein n=1 Tax=Candidatus Moduliflexus flocculans TaxID=1499966 RepID=A0A0S6W529_9BACT|nr:hypothetical protein U14_04749 [Candidatus Moduliflexus flocculans]
MNASYWFVKKFGRKKNARSATIGNVRKGETDKMPYSICAPQQLTSHRFFKPGGIYYLRYCWLLY